jgi:fermentation-respiration switch protein FrsA (DUF1100 family)
VRTASAINAALYAVALRENEPAVLQAEARKVVEAALEDNTSLTPEERQQSQGQIDQRLADLASPWLRTFLGLDPATALARLRIPVLAMNGTLDVQVTADENLAGIDAALKAAGNTDYRLVRLEGLNHLFQHARSGLPVEYGATTETFAPEALALMKDFILGTR